MSRFRKRPVEVDAVRFIRVESGEPEAIITERGRGEAWLHEAYVKPMEEAGALFSNGDGLMIRTLEGDLHVSPGDWIIRGTQGEIYPCKPEIFEEIYEPVGDGR